MSISTFSVRQWQFTLVVFALLSAMGLNAFFDIPRAEDPNFPVPVFTIVAVLPGADPADVEKLLSDPIEDVLNTLDDVKELRSVSQNGVANVIVEFEWQNIDVEKKYDDVVREMNALRPSLPAGLRRFEIKKNDMALTNIVQMALVSETAPYRELDDISDALKDRIERIPGVWKSEVWGVPKSEVRVALDLGRLTAMAIPVTRVTDAIGTENKEAPGGPIHAGARRFNLKTTGGYNDLQQIRDTVIGAHEGKIIKVQDVATVEWAYEEFTHLTRFNGQRAVFVTANQKDGQNIFKVRDAIHAELDKFAQTLPRDITLERGFDQSRSVERRLDSLYRDFLIALGLVLLTLLPLGLRASFVVMISIPLSLAIALTMLNFLGFSLNQLTISGLVLSLGLLVDDSIVVVENIARHLREGKTRILAAIEATSQISVAVLGCTATLIFAFLPLMFLPEGSGKYILSLPASVLSAVVASLFVSLTIIPFLASRLLSEKEHPEGNAVLRVMMRGIHSIYRPLLYRALNWPKMTVTLAALLFAGSLMLIPVLGFTLFPSADSRQFLVQISTPTGTSLDETKKAMDFVDATLRAHPEIKYVMSNLGRGNPEMYANVFQAETNASVAEALVELQEFNPRKTPALYDELRAAFASYPGAEILLYNFVNGPPIQAPIAIRVTGPDLSILKEMAGRLAGAMERTQGTRNIYNPLRFDRTDLNLGVDTKKAAVTGIAAGQIDQTVRLAMLGENIGKFRENDGDEYDIMVRLPMGDNHALDALDRIYVSTATGGATPLSLVTNPVLESGPNRIDRYNRERVVTLTAYPQTGYNTEVLSNKIVAEMLREPLPPGYTLSIGGDAEARQKSFAGLSSAILIAIFGILAVLILEFQSFRSSLVVAGVIPLGILGGLAGLFAAGYSLSFTASIGMVALIGIEIKNSILLVDFANQLRQQGTPLLEAIEQAGELRFLPVVLTSATAIGGLLPLALSGSGLYGPMSVVIIGGLLSSTFLSRLVTPALYLLLAPKDTA
jgi:multidrug efflux pump subunit AcrB